jgi:negative regulator of sigma-B (phosphoserine phosphatase)
VKVEIEGRVLAKTGERECGDTWIVREVEGATVIAVVDGLGHGSRAAEVALRASSALDAVESADPESVVEELHRALAGTRGAAAMVCCLRGAHLRGCGVGNVSLRSLGTKVPVVWTPGVLGVEVRRLRSFEAWIVSPTRLALFSDGISSQMTIPPPTVARGDACERVLDGWRHAFDDAAIVIVDLEPTVETR